MTVTGPDGAQRISPAIPAHAMKTYQVVMPLATHYRPATCAEYECEAYLYGWQTIVPADSPAAEYIRHDRTRRHVEERQPGGLTCFTFGPGQQGFAGTEADHKLPDGRPERFLERGRQPRRVLDGAVHQREPDDREHGQRQEPEPGNRRRRERGGAVHRLSADPGADRRIAVDGAWCPGKRVCTHLELVEWDISGRRSITG